MLFVYFDQLREYCNDRTDETDKSHCLLLITYFELEYKEIISKTKAMYNTGCITFDLAWTLFKPGTHAVSPISGTDQSHSFVVDHVAKDEDNKEKIYERRYIVYGHFLTRDDKGYGYCDKEVEIGYFSGNRKITKLEAYPLSDELERDNLLSRGRKFVALQSNDVRIYDGQVLVRKQKEKEEEVSISYVKGRIIIDMEGYWKWSEDTLRSVFLFTCFGCY